MLTINDLTIAVSSDANATEQFAAEELSHYLQQTTGITIPIVDSPKANNSIIIGTLGVAELPEDKKNKLEHDGFIHSYDGSNLVVTGNCPRGTLNGVYSLLHYWGFRWVYPKKEEEIIPELSDLPVPEGCHITNPDLELRGVCIFPVNQENIDNLREIIDWMGKNRINMLMTSVNRAKKRENGWIVDWMKVEDELLPEIQKRGIILNISEHSGRYFFPTSYFEEHPEWFAMKADGVRFAKGQICYSNDEAIEVLADNYEKYVIEHPEIDIIGTWPEDGYGFCQCESCKQPGTVLKAVNKVAERIEKVRPELTVEYLSYTEETSVVPEGILPRKNMAILVANTRVAKEWLAKSNKVGGLGVYQLHYHISDNTAERASLPLRFEKTRQDCLAAKETGIRGIIPFYIGIDTWWRSSLNLYFLSQFSWNLEKSSKDILTDFCDKYYQEAAPEMLTLFEALETIPMVNQHVPPPWKLWQNWPTLVDDYTGENWDKIMKEFSQRRYLLNAVKETYKNSSDISKRLSLINAFIDSAETMFDGWHERALAVMAFKKNDTETVRKHITNAAEHEQQLIKLYQSNEGVNGAWPDFSFFQNWRLQLDKQLLEMRTTEQQQPVTDENPDVELFLPGLLGA